MIQVTLDLENEHVLADNLKGLLNSLSQEQIQEIASKALFKYLTDILDYDKEKYIKQKIAESREKGIQTGSSWSSKSISNLENLSDDAIRKLDAFRDVHLKGYVSPKESRLNVINEMIDAEIKKSANKFVSDNTQLKALVSEKETKIAENFEVIIKDTVTNILVNIIGTTMQNAFQGSMTFNQNQNILDILQRNNLY